MGCIKLLIKSRLLRSTIHRISMPIFSNINFKVTQLYQEYLLLLTTWSQIQRRRCRSQGYHKPQFTEEQYINLKMNKNPSFDEQQMHSAARHPAFQGQYGSYPMNGSGAQPPYRGVPPPPPGSSGYPMQQRPIQGGPPPSYPYPPDQSMMGYPPPQMVPQPPYPSSSLYPQPSSIQQSLPRNPSQLVDVIDIKNLTNRISSKDNLDPQVEKILALMADEFIRNTAEFACKLAKHRDSDTLEKDDVKFAIEKLYNIQVPTKPTQLDQSGIRTQQQINFPQASTNNYKANLALVRKANEQ